MIHPWPLIASQLVFDTGFFRVTRDRACSPRTGGERDFHLIHMADWLMVVPLTREGRLVLVRQYRHGSRETGLEVPGGLHDRDGEGPGQGAVREVSEETGYGNDGEPLVFLGELRPQPALLSNRVWIFLARNVRPLAGQKLDPGEDIEVVMIEPHEIPARIASGEINNAMTVAVLSLAHLGGHLDEPRRSSGKEDGL
jgi:8-oxo-dGTP pyrophosphatase MutT (NUDIX family)